MPHVPSYRRGVTAVLPAPDERLDARVTVLERAGAGDVARIVRVRCPQARRLAELGIRPGATVRVLTRSAGGGLTVAVGTSRLALDRSVARGIELAGT